ncbi:MAG: radical SAM/SPASM domain-containing protein [Thermodesulfobacteriota bacterium]
MEKGQITGRHGLNLQIQTISACNAACVFCPYQESWHKSHPGIMTDKMYQTIIDETSRYRIGKFCPYLENEPLLDPRLFDRIEYARSRLNFSLLEISTNAFLLNQTKIDHFSRILPGSSHEIWISFHGIDKESFKSIMGLDFDICRENVLALIEKSQDNDIRIVIRGAGFARRKRENYPAWFNRKQYFKFWRSEFKNHHFKKLPEVRFFTYHDRAGQIKRNEINFSTTVRSSLKGFYCHRVDQWLHFLYTGELILCCMDYHRTTVFGDMRTKSLSAILGSDEFISLAEQVTGLTPSADEFLCKKCISPWDGIYTGK